MRAIALFDKNGKTYAALRCQWCTYAVDLEIDRAAFERWMKGELIQNVFPDMSLGLRELFISGTCNDCFDEMFDGSED